MAAPWGVGLRKLGLTGLAAPLLAPKAASLPDGLAVVAAQLPETVRGKCLASSPPPYLQIDVPYRRESGANNPGNNLHVSGLSHRVDTRDLEQAFAKVGRVRVLTTVSSFTR